VEKETVDFILYDDDGAFMALIFMSGRFAFAVM
jgi:hypothetical protein